MSRVHKNKNQTKNKKIQAEQELEKFIIIQLQVEVGGIVGKQFWVKSVWVLSNGETR